MNGNQITISVNSDDFDQLRKIARTRGQTVSDYISCLVSTNLTQSTAIDSGLAHVATNSETAHIETYTLQEARASLR